MKRLLATLLLLGFAVIGHAQDRSGVITGGAIPSQQPIPQKQKAEQSRKGVEEQYKRLVAATAKTESAVQLERPVEKAKLTIPSETGSGTVPPATTAPRTDLRSPAPSLPQLAQVPLPPKTQFSLEHETVSAPQQSQPMAITVTGPTLPINPNTEVVLNVGGLAYTDLERAAKTSVPQATLIPGQLNGRTILVFSSPQIGLHTVTVSVQLPRPEWLDQTEQGLAGAIAGGEVSASALAEFKSFAARLTREATTRSNSCVVQVGSPAPHPQPIPQPTPQPVPQPDPIVVVPPAPVRPLASGVVATIIIRIDGTIRDDQTEVLSDLRQWSDQQPKSKVAVIEVTPQNIGPNGELDPRLQTYLDSIPEGATQPYVFMVRVNPGRAGDKLWDGELPANADVLITKIQEYVSGARQPLIPRGNK